MINKQSTKPKNAKTPKKAKAKAETSGLLAQQVRDTAELLSDTSDKLNSFKEKNAKPPTLADRFLIPPFSVLDARQGYWQDRKRAWIEVGIESELGRGENLGGFSAQNDEYMYDKANYLAKKSSGLLGISQQARSHYNASPGGSLRPAMTLVDGKTVRGDGKGKPMNGLGAVANNEKGANGILTRTGVTAIDTQSWVKEKIADGDIQGGMANEQSGTSIFDPVLCEIVYRWFAGEGFSIIDPFAGGSVRGIVASKLNRKYTGIELRPEQIEANAIQAKAICKKPEPKWIEGDSREIDALAPNVYDLLFSCPPYADLEVYSDDPRDISTMSYADFVKAYRQIISKCCGMLKENRFACFVVGEVRDKKGIYRNFVSDTIAAFQDAGLKYYNEAILITSVGSLPIRVGRQFEVGRKVGKTHQNVLVFVKGDGKKAAEACGKVEVYDPAEAFPGIER